MRDLLREIEREWRERDEDRKRGRMQWSLDSTGVGRQVVEEPGLGPNRDSLGEETRGESVRERRTELMFKLINKGLSEEKLRE